MCSGVGREERGSQQNQVDGDEVSTVGTKQTDLIFDYYILDEIQDISRVGCWVLFNWDVVVEYKCWCWWLTGPGVAGIQVYKS